MTNDNNNTPKSASHMLYHELAANGGTSTNTPRPLPIDIVDRLMTKPPHYNVTSMDLANAANEIVVLRAMQIAYQEEILRLRDERDAARQDFCNASYDDPHLVARERGWDCFKNEKQNTYICDHCGDPVDSNNVFFFHTLPQDIASANKGESATTCRKCCEMIDANANNQDFRTTDMG
jgi:hypothetical protein